MSVTILALKRCSCRLFLQLFVGSLASYLYYLCLFAYDGVQHVFVSTWVEPWILVGSVLLIFLVFCVVYFCFLCLRPVSCVPNVASVSGLSIRDCTFGFL